MDDRAERDASKALALDHNLQSLGVGAQPADGKRDVCALCPIVVAARPVPPPEAKKLALGMPEGIRDSAIVRRAIRCSSLQLRRNSLTRHAHAPQVAYRSVGCGIWGVALRVAGMPLEKIALFANSGQVSGANPLTQAVRLTFAQGVLAPYRVIGPASIIAWFLQYSSMSFVFQLADSALSLGLDVPRVAYGDDVQKAPAATPVAATTYTSMAPTALAAVKACKDVAAASVAGAVESAVSNRAEAQRHYGPAQLQQVEKRLGWGGAWRAAGPAFAPNVSRNAVMAYSAFVLTPQLYQQMVPKEQKSSSSLFAFGLAVNMFLGNVVAVTQQSLWGRSLDRLAVESSGAFSYGAVVREGVAAEGAAAFITPGKWFSRVLMNAPAEGTLAWFYNRVLPVFEPSFLRAADGAYAGVRRWRPFEPAVAHAATKRPEA